MNGLLDISKILNINESINDSINAIPSVVVVSCVVITGLFAILGWILLAESSLNAERKQENPFRIQPRPKQEEERPRDRGNVICVYLETGLRVRDSYTNQVEALDRCKLAVFDTYDRSAFSLTGIITLGKKAGVRINGEEKTCYI